MDEYLIFETEQFQEDLKKKLSSGEEKIIKKLHTFVYPQIRKQPPFGKNIKKLKGFRPETWRYRIGDYRFFYEIDEKKKKIVFMIAAESRQRSY